MRLGSTDVRCFHNCLTKWSLLNRLNLNLIEVYFLIKNHCGLWYIWSIFKSYIIIQFTWSLCLWVWVFLITLKGKGLNLRTAKGRTFKLLRWDFIKFTGLHNLLLTLTHILWGHQLVWDWTCRSIDQGVLILRFFFFLWITDLLWLLKSTWLTNDIARALYLWL